MGNLVWPLLSFHHIPFARSMVAARRLSSELQPSVLVLYHEDLQLVDGSVFSMVVNSGQYESLSSFGGNIIVIVDSKLNLSYNFIIHNSILP